MTTILVRDIFEDLKEENRRLLNELLYAKQCLKVFVEFKIDFDFYSNKFKQSLEINEWKKFEKFDENISEIVSKIPINREKTNNNNMSEEYVDIKTEMPFNVNTNDNSNDGLNESNYDLTEEQMQRRVETNRRLKEMFVERDDNYLKDIIRQTAEEINDYHSVGNNIEEETDVEDSIEDMSVLKRNKLKQYQKIKHHIRRKKMCPKCSKPILTDIRFKVHLNMHQNNGVFKCWQKDCNKEKFSELTAISHLRRHRISQEMKADPSKRFRHSCDWPGCDYKAKLPRLIESHKTYVHLPESTSRRFACEHPGCDKKFKMKQDLTIHLDTHSTERVKCELCGKDYKTYISLRNHIRSQHTKAKTFVCDHKDCDYEAYSTPNLYNHKINAHASRTVVCTFEGCDKKFTNKYHMKDHLESHNTELAHKCPIGGCDKAFKYKARLKVHLREKHTDETYSCDWPGCDFETKSRASYRNHSAVHKTERDFLCEWPQCGKGFKSRAQLKRHERIHTNDKRYVCSWTGCQYSTTDSSNFIKHKKQVHEKTSNFNLTKH